MKNRSFLVSKILALAIVFTFSACQKSEVKEAAPSTLENEQNSYATIKDVNFKNFTYPIETGKDTFTLKDGETPFGKGSNILFALENIEFADVTGDKEDEAIIKILVEYGGNASDLVYVYTLENKKPKKIWSAATGYADNGALKRFYSENGTLIIELFGSNQFIESTGKFEFTDKEGAPKKSKTPTTFTKFRFNWNGEKFVLEGAPEVLDYDSNHQMNETPPRKSDKFI